MVWGVFSFNFLTLLSVLKGNLNGECYLQIIQPLVLPTLERIGAGGVFQDDKARPHRARIVTDS